MSECLKNFDVLRIKDNSMIKTRNGIADMAGFVDALNDADDFAVVDDWDCEDGAGVIVGELIDMGIEHGHFVSAGRFCWINGKRKGNLAVLIISPVVATWPAIPALRGMRKPWASLDFLNQSSLRIESTMKRDTENMKSGKKTAA
jgi:hypothetical protein